MNLEIIYQDYTYIILKETRPTMFSIEEAESLLNSNNVNLVRKSQKESKK